MLHGVIRIDADGGDLILTMGGEDITIKDGSSVEMGHSHSVWLQPTKVDRTS